MAKYRILSIDGGGIKGLVTAIILQRLSKVERIGGWLEKCDLIAGTSTGGLLALALGHGLNLESIREIYEKRGEKIFDDSWLDDLQDLGKITGADYGISNLEKELKGIFGPKLLLSDLSKRVLITAFDLDNEDKDGAKRTWKPKLFHNFPGSDFDGAVPVYKVGLYTSAAPTYFESYEGYIDGGVFAGNPSMCALAQALDSERNSTDTRLSDVALLSLGTGTSLRYIKGKNLDWGYAQWAKPLISLMLDGVSGIADFQCRQFLGDRYHRLGPVFPTGKTIDMDDWEKSEFMVEFASQLDLAKTVEFIESQWI